VLAGRGVLLLTRRSGGQRVAVQLELHRVAHQVQLERAQHLQHLRLRSRPGGGGGDPAVRERRVLQLHPHHRVRALLPAALRSVCVWGGWGVRNPNPGRGGRLWWAGDGVGAVQHAPRQEMPNLKDLSLRISNWRTLLQPV
jgi:hypothetical protein